MSERAPLPRAEAHPPRGRVLLLAPHADDDVIGAGGTCCQHVEAGDPLHVIVAFNGVRGDATGEHDPAAYAALRRQEAQAGGKHLGFESYEFWDYPEGHQPGPEEYRIAARHLAARVRELEPDIVYTTWVGEHHLDHHVLGRVTRMALHLANFQGEAWGYEVWTPLIPTKVIDITGEYARKVAGLREHKSQLEHQDLVHVGLALTAQRSVYGPPGCRQAEAFCPLGPPTEGDLALLDGGEETHA